MRGMIWQTLTSFFAAENATAESGGQPETKTCKVNRDGRGETNTIIMTITAMAAANVSGSSCRGNPDIINK